MSLGVYPGDPCYDASRPDWLPYWLDDLTESDCKWNGQGSIVMATGNALVNPEIVAANVGGVMGQGAGAAVSDVATGIESTVSAAATGAASTLNTGGSLLMIAAVLFGGLFLLETFKR